MCGGGVLVGDGDGVAREGRDNRKGGDETGWGEAKKETSSSSSSATLPA